MADFADTQFHFDADEAPIPTPKQAGDHAMQPPSPRSQATFQRRFEAAQQAMAASIQREHRLQELFVTTKRQAHAQGRAEGLRERQLSVWLWGASTGALAAAALVVFLLDKAA